ncbi:hypothetical protein AOZ06_04770 [Kibdelosporangium phytohabitans]|uniref:ParB/Sulfiredoxin domain-containing protein n=2 Tax=Kibdelosporangium phytohabitans TaxID=860235 RepID=A0A0N7F2N5_9PSEU|nr:hypothetical protein AOZ06_04770 [Kibdelosporangium phytohabitans]
MSKWRFVEVNPEELLTDQNARTIEDIEAEKPVLCASIRRHGVLIPVIANEVGDGRFQVRDGHCRTLIARKYVDVRPTIDVAVTESVDEKEWHRLRDLYIYNHHREGFSVSDTAQLMAELALFVTPEEIAAELSQDLDVVNANLAVTRSPRTIAASQQHPEWDLLILLALSEFEDDEPAHEKLVTSLRDDPYEFDYTVRALRAERERREAVDAVRDELRETGVTVLEADGTAGRDELPGATTLPLNRLYVSSTDRTVLTVDTHTDCPGHGAVVRPSFGSRPTITYVCADFALHGHVDTVVVAVQDTVGQLDDAGTTVVDADLPDTTEKLSNLVVSADDPAVLTVDNHTHCPGHAAYVTPARWSEPTVTYVCVNYTDHGHVRDESGVAAAAAAAAFKNAESSRARANNKKWLEDALPRRRAWLRDKFFPELLASDKPLSAAAEDIVLAAMNLPGDRLQKAKMKGNVFACELLGLKAPKPGAKHPIDVKRKRASIVVKGKIMLAIVLAAFEEYYDAEHSKTTWRSPYAEDQFFFTALNTLKYKALHVEQLVLDPTADAVKWPHLAPAGARTATDDDQDTRSSDLAEPDSDADTVSGTDAGDAIQLPDDTGDTPPGTRGQDEAHTDQGEYADATDDDSSTDLTRELADVA